MAIESGDTRDKGQEMTMNSKGKSGEQINVPVLIVGVGPVGLALACELGSRGVKALLVERRDGSITLPKMNQVGVRTMEFCRRWGVAQRVQEASIPDDFPRTITFVTSTGPNGHEMARYEFPSRRDESLVDSPEALQRCSQLYFDPILRDLAVSFPSVSLQYKAVLDSFEQDGDGVTAVVEDLSLGVRFNVRSSYLVGCDGAVSGVREKTGIGLLEDRPLSFNNNIFFRSSDLDSLCPRGRAMMQWIIGPNGVWAMLSSVDGKDLWRLSVRSESGDRVTKEQAADLIRRAVGRDFVFETVEPILSWVRRSALAESFSDGRVFLCGDSAHQLSPTGGFGMNTGIQEAVDLGWKLAAVLQGWGGPRLLSSYDSERRPIAKRAVDEGAYNFKQFNKLPIGTEICDETAEGQALRDRIGRTIIEERFDREYDMIGMALGYRYESSPIVVADGSAEPPDDPTKYVPTARPGHRAPHAWIDGGRSTLDLFGHGYTLLRLGAEPIAVDAIMEAAARKSVPLAVIDLPQLHVHELYQRRLVLVRPDGHVAWRGDQIPAEPEKLIDVVRGADAGSPSKQVSSRTTSMNSGETQWR